VTYLIILFIQSNNRNPIHLINIISEFLGATARLIYFTDPMGCYRILATQFNIAVFIFMFPFTLINCLLLALYFQDTLRSKDIKVFHFITPKTSWIFYSLCILSILILIFVPILRSTAFYDSYRLICVIIIAAIAVGIGIFSLFLGTKY